MRTMIDLILDSAPLWPLLHKLRNLGAGCGESDADFSRLTRLLLDGNLVIASDGRQKRKQGGRCLEVHRWTGMESIGFMIGQVNPCLGLGCLLGGRLSPIPKI